MTTPRSRTPPPRRARAAAPIALAALAAALGAGCATVAQPPSDAPVARVDVADVQRAPPVEPVAVRWGGTIASVTNADAETTVLEIVARPLGASGRPRHVDASPGRFVAEVDGFLDPEIVRAGRDVTVTGTVADLRDGRVGDAEYRFPVVEVEAWRYWKPAARTVAHPGPYGPYAYGPYGYGHYGYAHDPFSFHQRFWYEFYNDPLHPHARRPRGGRVGVGVTVRP